MEEKRPESTESIESILKKLGKEPKAQDKKPELEPAISGKPELAKDEKTPLENLKKMLTEAEKPVKTPQEEQQKIEQKEANATKKEEPPIRLQALAFKEFTLIEDKKSPTKFQPETPLHQTSTSSEAVRKLEELIKAYRSKYPRKD